MATKKADANRVSFRARIASEDEQAGPKGGASGETAYVELAFDVKETFGKARPPVLVTVNGYTYASTVAVYGGRSYLPVRRSHREKANVALGDEVDVVVALDTSERKVAPPPELAKALRANATAKAAWEALSFTHQREHAEAIEQAKKAETRARRVEKAIELLLAKPRPKR